MFLFFGEFETNDSTEHCLIITSISHLSPPIQPGAFPLGTNKKKKNEVKRDKTKIRVGDFVTVKIRDIDEKIKEGKIRRMRKDQASALQLHCNSHLFAVVILSCCN